MHFHAFAIFYFLLYIQQHPQALLDADKKIKAKRRKVNRLQDRLRAELKQKKVLEEEVDKLRADIKGVHNIYKFKVVDGKGVWTDEYPMKGQSTENKAKSVHGSQTQEMKEELRMYVLKCKRLEERICVLEEENEAHLKSGSKYITALKNSQTRTLEVTQELELLQDQV